MKISKAARRRKSPEHSPLVLYSATTKLAYSIAEKYYSGVHYVWCAPRPNADRFQLQNPPSSDPISIYWRYERDVSGGDQHSELISANRLGITRGAFARQKQGIIDKTTRDLIEAIVSQVPLGGFQASSVCDSLLGS